MEKFIRKISITRNKTVKGLTQNMGFIYAYNAKFGSIAFIILVANASLETHNLSIVL